MTDRSARTTTPEPTTAPSTSARLRLALLLGPAALLAACSSAPPQRSYPQPLESDSGPSSRLSDEQASSIAIHALGLVGTPYRYGGNTPESGFDCSGLIGYVYWHAARIRTPRTVAQLSDWGQPVPAHAANTGDLVIFMSRGRTNHAGILVGDGRFVHAPSTGGTVRMDNLSARHWASQPRQFRRA